MGFGFSHPTLWWKNPRCAALANTQIHRVQSLFLHYHHGPQMLRRELKGRSWPLWPWSWFQSHAHHRTALTRGQLLSSMQKTLSSMQKTLSSLMWPAQDWMDHFLRSSAHLLERNVEAGVSRSSTAGNQEWGGMPSEGRGEGTGRGVAYALEASLSIWVSTAF